MTISQTGDKKGFTLVEVMATVVVLSLCTLLVQEGFLQSLGMLTRYSNALKAQLWMDEAIGSAQAELLYSETPSLGTDRGTFLAETRAFQWQVSQNMAMIGKDLFEIEANVSWSEGNQPVRLTKKVYAEQPSLF